MKSKKDRCTALNEGQTNPVNPYGEGTDQRGSSFVENNLGVLMDESMTSHLNPPA